MPEYLAPGVFVEETSFRQKSIEGVSTSTTGFVGPTRFGPVDGEPPLLTSFTEFERIYGGLDRLRMAIENEQVWSHNFLAQAVRAYFEEGGKRLYVSRVFERLDTDDEHDGKSAAEVTDGSNTLRFRARHPGRAGNRIVRLVFKAGEDIRKPAPDPSNPSPPPADWVLVGARKYDVVIARRPGSSPPDWEVFWVDQFVDSVSGKESHRLRQNDPDVEVEGSPPGAVEINDVDEVRVVTVSLIVEPDGRFGEEQAWENLTFSIRHRDESLASLLSHDPTRRSIELYSPLVLTDANDGPVSDNPFELADTLLAQDTLVEPSNPNIPRSILEALVDPNTSAAQHTLLLQLTGGNDGEAPGLRSYEGDDGEERKSGLKAFEDLEDISIIAAPGSTFSGFQTAADADPIRRAVISHCERMRYRIAVLDSQDQHMLSDVQNARSSLDSTRAAFYYPWVRIFDPVTEDDAFMPPSGFITGIYARNDVERGVHKTPANEVVRSATGFEFLLNKAQQEALNPKGINCLRYFEGRGFRVWGGRTISSDPEFKYVNVRRYMAYLERSIEKGTQWAVFENNGPILWDNVRRTVEDFLFNEWKENHLLGLKPEQAYFVRCDRTTISQNDLDNGRLICLIGVAVLKPAEFVIFRIGQKTVDA